jgi:hypothetical protein
MSPDNRFTTRNDDPPDDEYPCQICGEWAEDCVCPECPVCRMYGNPECIGTHAPATLWSRKEEV